MTDRKTITVDREVYERLEPLKKDDESWNEFGDRVADLLEADGQEDGEHSPNTAEPLTVDHIDDIVAKVERRVGREIENRLTRP
jgi:hypothetical protein